LGGLTGSALDQAKAQATLELLTKQTTNAQGMAAKESGTLQGQTTRLSAQYKDLSAKVGTKLLPVITGAIEKFTALTEWVGKNKDIVIPAAAAIGGLAAAVVVVNTAAKAYAATQAALNVVMALNPIGLVVIAVAALAAGLVIAYRKSETFRDVVNGAFVKVLGAVSNFLGGIQKMLEVLGKIPGFGWADTAANKVKGARNAVDGLANAIRGIPPYKRVTVEYAQINNIGRVPHSARAKGGPVMPGQPYLVGEEGPEMIVPRRSGHVLTAKETAAARTGGSAGGAGVTNNYNLTVNGTLDERISDQTIAGMFCRMELLAGTRG
jgi:hypothetical protein